MWTYYFFQPFLESFQMHLRILVLCVCGLVFYAYLLVRYFSKSGLTQHTLSVLNGYVFPCLLFAVLFSLFYWYIALPAALLLCIPFSRSYAEETLYLAYARDHRAKEPCLCNDRERVQEVRAAWQAVLETGRMDSIYQLTRKVLLKRFWLITLALYAAYAGANALLGGYLFWPAF